MSRSPERHVEPRTSISAEVTRLGFYGRDSLGRAPSMIERQLKLELELESMMRRVRGHLDAGAIALGQEGGDRLRQRVEAARLTFARVAERDRRLLAEFAEFDDPPPAEEGSGGRPPLPFGKSVGVPFQLGCTVLCDTRARGAAADDQRYSEPELPDDRDPGSVELSGRRRAAATAHGRAARRARP